MESTVFDRSSRLPASFPLPLSLLLLIQIHPALKISSSFKGSNRCTEDAAQCDEKKEEEDDEDEDDPPSRSVSQSGIIIIIMKQSASSGALCCSSREEWELDFLEKSLGQIIMCSATWTYRGKKQSLVVGTPHSIWRP